MLNCCVTHDSRFLNVGKMMRRLDERLLPLLLFNPAGDFYSAQAADILGDAAIFCRYSAVRSRRSSPGLLTNEISARIDGILAPISTMNGAFFTPRSRI